MEPFTSVEPAIFHDEAVDRVVELDVDDALLWELVGTADGWTRWLADAADVDVEVGAVGEVTDGELVRHVRIDGVERGRSVGFTWWHDDDPSSLATVELRIEDLSVSSKRLHIVERRAAGPGGPLPVSGSSSCSVNGPMSNPIDAASLDLLDRRLAWETRLWLLGSCGSALSLR